MNGYPKPDPMGILKKIAAQHRRNRRQLKRLQRDVAKDVASMKDDETYTMHTKSGQSLTLTGSQWKQLEQERSSRLSSLPQD